MKDKKIPQSSDIERAVLSEMILENNIIPLVINTGEDLFYIAQHQGIFKAIDILYTENGNIDQLTLTEQLKNDGNLDNVGGEATIAAICSNTFSAAFIEDHLKILREKSVLRKLLTLGMTTTNECYRNNADSIEIAHNIEVQLSDIKENITNNKPSIVEQVKEWALLQDRDFSVTDCYNDLGFVTSRDKAACRAAISRMVSKEIEKSGNRLYRAIDTESEIIDYLNAPTDEIEIVYPFEIENYVEIFPGNIIVIAGEQNAGKTAFLLNFVKMNMYSQDIWYFNSEMGETELRKRLEKFTDINLQDWKFNPRERSQNFADVIQPDSVNIIDFLEIHDEFYKVGGYLKQIHDKLKKGIALIAIQKNKDTDYGLGGARGLEKPRLYLAMEPGKLKIVKAKNWKTESNPNHLEIEFKLVKGCKFISDKKGWTK